MARKPRIQYPGAIYHVMSRGDHQEEIFKDDTDRQAFLATLGEACEKTGWQVHAYCLMHNHFHLVVETPQPNLVPGMKWLLGSFTMRYNRRHGLFGHLFAGRYKALFVDGSGNGYLKTVCDYVHLNPARANVLAPEERLSSYAWSSFGAYLAAPRKRPAWLRVDRVLGEHGIRRDSTAGRREFEKRLEWRRASELNESAVEVEGRWMIGSEEFRKELLAQILPQINGRFGAEVRESAEEQAHRIVAEELRKLRWDEAELESRRKGDKQKVRIAQRLRQETTMTIAWIAERLRMGTGTHLTHLLYWAKRGE